MKTKIRVGRNPGGMRLLVVALASCGLVSVSQASSNTLTPGGSLFPVNAGPGISAGATLVASNSVAWASSPTSINGTLVSTVWSGDANNPYGGLTFTYQVFLNASSINGLGQFTVSSFAGFPAIDVTYDPSTLGILSVVPNEADRSLSGLDAGEDLNFRFFGEMSPGFNSVTLDVDTGAANYYTTLASLIDHVAVPDVETFGPTPLTPSPEPSTIGLMSTAGVCMLAYLRRWKSRGR
jgi:hypothetical protein